MKLKRMHKIKTYKILFNLVREISPSTYDKETVHILGITSKWLGVKTAPNKKSKGQKERRIKIAKCKSSVGQKWRHQKGCQGIYFFPQYWFIYKRQRIGDEKKSHFSKAPFVIGVLFCTSLFLHRAFLYGAVFTTRHFVRRSFCSALKLTHKFLMTPLFVL